MSILLPVIFFLLYFFLALNGCYYVTEGSALLSVYGTAERIDLVLEKNEIPADERELLLSVKKIRTFAIQDLGLLTNENYTTYVQLDRDYLATIVSACTPDSFNQYKWDYLCMGKLPYKGFFKREDALAEAERLKNQGFDVYVRPVDAFSTLGMLSDPIFSYMKDYSSYALSNLIIHEQTHATKYFTKDVDFSENIASFIADKGAIDYIKKEFGSESKEYESSLSRLADREAFVRQLQELFFQLQELYEHELDSTVIIEKKQVIIETWKIKFNAEYNRNFQSDLYRKVPEIPINNAFLMTFRNYTGNLDEIAAVYALGNNNLTEFIGFFKQLPDDAEHPLAELKKIITNHQE